MNARLAMGALILLVAPTGGVAHETSASSADDLAAAPENGGPRNWEVVRPLNLREHPSTAARVVATYRPGTVLDNLGCQRAQGRAWCDVHQLGGGLRGYVAAEYLRPAISPDGSAAMGPDDSALRAGQGEFDATGPLPCAFAPGQPMGQCEFGVARAGGGYATVVIRKPDGRTRAIFFRMGRPIGADVSESEGRPIFRGRMTETCTAFMSGTNVTKSRMRSSSAADAHRFGLLPTTLPDKQSGRRQLNGSIQTEQ